MTDHVTIASLHLDDASHQVSEIVSVSYIFVEIGLFLVV